MRWRPFGRSWRETSDNCLGDMLAIEAASVLERNTTMTDLYLDGTERL